MRRHYDGWPIVIGPDTRSFARLRRECNCNSEITWLGSIAYERSSDDFLKVLLGVLMDIKIF